VPGEIKEQYFHYSYKLTHYNFSYNDTAFYRPASLENTTNKNSYNMLIYSYSNVLKDK